MARLNAERLSQEGLISCSNTGQESGNGHAKFPLELTSDS
jgi:hypothetical protein